MKAKRFTVDGARRAALLTALVSIVGASIAMWTEGDPAGACRSVLAVRVILAPGVMIDIRLDR